MGPDSQLTIIALLLSVASVIVAELFSRLSRLDRMPGEAR
jgi:hypothetical protein